MILSRVCVAFRNPFLGSGSYPSVMQVSRTTCERRSLADSFKGASRRRSCWGKPSYSTAPASMRERTFFIWRATRYVSSSSLDSRTWTLLSVHMWVLPPPLGAPSHVCHQTASLWPLTSDPRTLCSSRSGHKTTGEIMLASLWSVISSYLQYFKGGD